MGVRGLLSYLLRHRERGTTQKIDLVQEARSRGRSGVTLLVDLVDFAAWLLPQVDQLAKEYEPDSTFSVYGGEFLHHDEALSSMIFSLRNAGIYLEFFVDAPRGCGLVDVTSGAWADEAKRKCIQCLDGAKAVRQWCRGERGDLPALAEEARCQPPLWHDQLRSSLARCGCHVWYLAPEEQVPLLSLGRSSDWGHVWGVVSDNVDWAVVRGVRLIPLVCFDVDGDIRPCLKAAGDSAEEGWPEALRLSVSYTTSELLAEHLRLGHPPREEELRDATATGKGRGPVGYGNWPYKWWFDQVLVELALLCGTDSTTPFIQKHKLYAQLGLQVGQDPVDSIVRWVRNQLYTNKLWWRDVHLEALSPVISELINKDWEFALAVKCSRAVYSQHVSGVRSVQTELAKRAKEAGSSSKTLAATLPQSGEQIELPEASSLFVRSAALASRVWLDVCFEDVARNGAPLTHQLLTDLRRLTYLLLRRTAVHEHGVMGEQRSGVSSHLMDLEASSTTIPALHAIQRWPFAQRWGVFRRIVEHNVLQAEAAAGAAEGAMPPTVEVAVWDAFKASHDSSPSPSTVEAGFVSACLEYFVSLNLRPEAPLIREHEFNSIAAMVALCCDVTLPGAPLAHASEWQQQRLGEVKGQLCNMVAGNFHQSSELRLPVRAVALGSWLQAATRHLLDITRLLWLDYPDAGGGTPVFLPEPRELYSGCLLAALYMGGAYDEWELQLPTGDSQYRWKGLLRQISQLRQEVMQCSAFQSWRRWLVQDFHRGSISWPSQEQLQAESKRNSQGQEELPIDEHREKILKHVENHRVTCIQGETGCGKSTRVPVYVMEDYFEKRRNGLLGEEDKFMVLCTQPRRIACISLANRVATCLKERVGDTIGYKISGDSCVRPGRTKLIYVTTGYLLQVLVNNPEQIRSYTHLILDEVHERDVDSDLLSLVVKLQMSDYKFKLVIMSATLQGDLFTRYFSEKKMKTIFVGVKRYPVEMLYIEQLGERYGGRYSSDFGERRPAEGTRGIQAPFSSQAIRAMRDAERCFGTGGYEAEGLDEEEQRRPKRGEFEDSESSDDSDAEASEEPEELPVAKAVAPRRRRKEVNPNILRGLDILVYELISRVAQPGEGILIFLPGIGEITELHETLLPLEDTDREAHMSWDPSVPRPDCRFKVFVLHSLIPKDEQEGAVFDSPPADTTHVILASNIAESSLTIPKVRVVIDFGLRRQLVYDKRRHMSCLVTAWVSQASAKQRSGRTGRVFDGICIRLFTKQFHDSYLEEFDPPEMQTAPLEKLYVNVKHLSRKLPEYQVSPTETRRRTPKELLHLTAQPPEMASIESSIEVLDQLGALTDASESADLTVLGYLMMSVPLDVHLCRLVVFGALLGLPAEGVVSAAALSVQDPFTLPSHLIIKDPREYAEALKRSYETRHFFDHGHCSEPLMLRNLFVHWLADFRKMIVDRCGRRGGYRSGRESHRVGFLRCAQGMAQKFAVVPKRIVHLATAVLDTATRMRKFIPEGSDVLRQLDALIALLQAGDRWFSSSEDAEAQLPKINELFCNNYWKLKGLLIMAFTPQFMMGSTKVRTDEPLVDKSWKKKKRDGVQRKDKNKMEQLLDEIVEHGLEPTRTVACVLEMPRGRGGMSRWHHRFLEDLKATIEMITCGEKFSVLMPGENKVFITFEKAASKSAFEGLAVPDVTKLEEEPDLIEDLPMGAHFVDLYGAGRWKFTVPMLNSAKIEQERAEKQKAAALARGEVPHEEAKRQGEQAEPEGEKQEDAQQEHEEAHGAEATEDAAGQGKGEDSVPAAQGEDEQHENAGAEEAPAAEEAEAVAAKEEVATNAKNATVEDPSELGPLIGIYRPVSPYEINWEIVEQITESPSALKKGVKVKPKRKVTKGRCSWRNPVGFLGSCKLTQPGSLQPWPNDIIAVFTTVQGGDSKEVSWVDGVTLLSSEGDGLLAFALLVSFLRYHQELSFEVELQEGRIYAVHGPAGLEFQPRPDQLLLVEDIAKINAVRVAVSQAFYTKASPVPTTVDREEGIDFAGSRGRRDDEPVPQIAAKPRVAEALDDLLQVLREASNRMDTMDEATWNERCVLRKPLLQTVDMHRDVHRLSEESGSEEHTFQLLEPLADLVQVKLEAEHRQLEEDERKRRYEEEKRRKKDEERRKKEEDKRQRKLDEQRRREEKRLRSETKKSAKGAGKAQATPDDVRQQQQQQPQLDGGKGKGKKGEAQAKQGQQAQPKKEKQQGNRGKKQKEDGQAEVGSYGDAFAGFGMGFELPHLPAPWLAVPDPSTGRLYYWNQSNNEVTWTQPQMPGSANSGGSQQHLQQELEAYGRPAQASGSGASGGAWPTQEFGYMPGPCSPGMQGYPGMIYPFGQRGPTQSEFDWQ